MPTTALLVFAGHNHLRYRITDDGDHGTCTITSTGAATPDLLTDSAGLAGPINKAARQNANGYGKCNAGAIGQNAARNIWLADNTGVLPAGQNPGSLAMIPRMKCELTRRGVATAGADVFVEADVSGGVAELQITPNTAGVYYLDVEIMNGPSAGIGA